MRGKRSKQYRKLMQQYGLTFGFREPYQVLVDVGMLEASVVQYKMDLVASLHRTLHGEVKPMLTECTIRQLYNLPTTSSTQPQSQTQTPSKSAPKGSTSKPNDSMSKTDTSSPSSPPPTLTPANKTALITLAKTFEKRRCDHHDSETPLSTHACLSSVIDPKSNQTNKHRYVIAVQDDDLRNWARDVRGVPSIYVRRSVMIMEPMADVSVSVKLGAEKEKLRGGVKRKRAEDVEADVEETAENGAAEAREVRKKKMKGPKGVNPLSMQKPKKRADDQSAQRSQDGEGGVPRKRRRKHKPSAGNADGADAGALQREVDAE